MTKLFLTAILLAIVFIPGVDAYLAVPVVAALGYVWGFAPTK
ncbi:MAG: hypothetical protein ACRED1_06355 [Limisphaerales bacterium]